MAASSLVGMVFLKGVVRLYVGTSPVAVSFFANSVKRNDALSVPAFCITESIASIHSWVSRKSISGLSFFKMLLVNYKVIAINNYLIIILLKFYIEKTYDGKFR